MSAIVAFMVPLVDSRVSPEMESASSLASLLEAVQARDRSAFEALYDATIQRVFSLAMRFTRQQELADEVVNDVYLQVWQQAASYTPDRGKVIAWLSMLCRSRSLDAMRRDTTRIRKACVDLDAVAEPAETIEPPDLLEAVEQGSAVQAALGRLTHEQRQLMSLAYFRGYSHSELAGFMEMPIGTVKTQLRRATIKLKELMLNDVKMIGGRVE